MTYDAAPPRAILTPRLLTAELRHGRSYSRAADILEPRRPDPRPVDVAALAAWNRRQRVAAAEYERHMRRVDAETSWHDG